MSKLVKLKRLLATPITDGPHETPELVDQGVPFMSAESVKNGYLDFDLRRGNITEAQHLLYCLKAKPQRDDVLMVKSGATTGKVAIVDTDEEFSIWSPLALIRANKARLNPRYLYYSLKSDQFQKQVENNWSFGTQQNIGMQVIGNLTINDINLARQEKTVELLDKKTQALDKMIAGKNYTHTQLSELRQAIITNAMRTGGTIMSVPKVRLKSVARVLNGATPKSDNVEYWDGDIAWATPVDLSNLESKYIESTTRTITQTGYISCNTTLVEPGNIVMSNRAPIGLLAINKIPLCTNQGCKILLLNKEKVDPSYLYYVLNSLVSDLQNLGTGTTFMEISADSIKNIEIPLPPLNEQRKISNEIDAKLSKLDLTSNKLTHSIKLLDEYRSSLISNVVGGKVAV